MSEVRGRRAPLMVSAAVIVSSWSCAEMRAPSRDTASSPGWWIRDVTVIDASHGVRPRYDVLVRGERIVAVGPTGTLTTALQGFEDEPQVIEGAGRFLIPGLWDFHVHLTYDSRWTARMPALFLAWGVTSVRDTGGAVDRMLPLVERLERGPGPRLFWAGPLLDGVAAVYDGDQRPQLGVALATPERAREQVRELAELGADFVKAYELLSEATFRAVVEEAHDLGLPVDSHIPLAMRARDAGPLVDSLEHLRNVELDCANNAEQLHEQRLQTIEQWRQTSVDRRVSAFDLRRQIHQEQRNAAIAAYDESECDVVIEALRGTVQVPTLRLNRLPEAPPFADPDWPAALTAASADVRAEWQTIADGWQADPSPLERPSLASWSRFLSGRLLSAGVPFAAGTDTPIGLSIPGFSLHRELELLVDAGFEPMAALEAATISPARWFGVDGEMGQVSPGHLADLLLLGADPLDDIRNTRTIEWLVQRGVAQVPGDLLATLSEEVP